MRRVSIVSILLLALTIPAKASDTKPLIALVFESGPNGKYTHQLLDGLYDRGLRATFLLQGSRMAESPQILERILAEGHEIGCRGYTGQEMPPMTRRAIAEEIMAFQSLLPPAYPLKLFCPPGGYSDGVRQVAVARKLGVLSWKADANTPPERIQDGDLLLLRDRSSQAVADAMALVDRLLEQDFLPVTVTELARHRNAKIMPGQVYSSFPPENNAE